MTSPPDHLRPPPWHPAVVGGDFDALPDPLRWEETGHFALLIDGYAVAGGHSRAAVLRRNILAEIERTGTSTADALDLWAALFFSWRRLRFVWGDLTDAQVAILDRLCGCLRHRLTSLTLNECDRVQKAMAVSPWSNRR